MNNTESKEDKTSPGEMKEESAGDELIMITPEGFDFSLYVPTGKDHLTSEEGKLPALMARNRAFISDLLFDLGARTGFFSVMMAEANPELEVIAIESDEPDFIALEKNLGQLKARGQKVQYLRTWFDSNEEFESFFPEFSGDLHKTRKPFIRIDKKGEEMDFLSKLKPVLQGNNQATILIKAYPGKGLQDGHNEKLFEFLYSIGYKLFGLDEEDYRYYPLDIAGNAGRLSTKYENSFFYVLCLPESRALSVVFFAHDPLLSGASRSLLDLIRGLSEEGVLCTVIVPFDRELAESIRLSGIATLALSDLPALQNNWLWADASNYDLQTARRKFSRAFQLLSNYILPEIGKISPDLVYSQTVVSPWGTLVAGAMGLPHVLSVREYGQLDHNLNFHFGFEKSVKALYDSAGAVFCVSNDVKNTLFGMDEGKKARVIYSGIQLDPKYVGEMMDKPKLYSPSWEKGVKVGIFGTVMAGKGQEDIVMACLELLNKGYNIQCLLAGNVADWEYYGELRRRIADLGYSHNFQWLEFAKNPYLLMQEVDIVISCSRLEAMGRTLIEASLLSKPFIYTNSGGNKEAYHDGEHGLSYEVGDYNSLAKKIIETIDKPEETLKRISNARAYVSVQFNRKEYTQKVLGTLREVVANKTAAADFADLIKLMRLPLMNDAAQEMLMPKIYYSDANGRFSEQQSLKHEEISPGYFSVEFDLGEQGYPSIRFDPAEKSAVKLRLYSIEAHTRKGIIPSENITVNYSNGEMKDKMSWKFFNRDPQMHFYFREPVSRIRFTGELYLIPDQEYIDYLSLKLEETSKSLNKLNVTSVAGGEQAQNTICHLFLSVCLKMRRILFKVFGVRR